MEVFEQLCVTIPNAVLVSGTTEDVSEIEEVIDFLKRYGAICRTKVVDELQSEFYNNWIVEYNSGAALAALEPLLPYSYETEDGKNSYLIQCLASIYAEREGK